MSNGNFAEDVEIWERVLIRYAFMLMCQFWIINGWRYDLWSDYCIFSLTGEPYSIFVDMHLIFGEMESI
jgi:hypothetical protein